MRIALPAIFIAAALVGCLGARSPAGRTMREVPAAEGDAAVDAALARRSSCIDARTRTEIERCSSGRTVRLDDVESALAEMDAEFVAMPPPAPVHSDAGRGGESDRRELRRRTPRPKQLAALETMEAFRCQHPSDLEVTFRLAQLRFELHDWDAAALHFSRVAGGPAREDRSIEAFMRYLEVLNVLGSHFGRTECFDEIEESLPVAIRRFCTFERIGFNRPARATACEMLGRIECDIHRLAIQRVP